MINAINKVNAVILAPVRSPIIMITAPSALPRWRGLTTETAKKGIATAAPNRLVHIALPGSLPDIAEKTTKSNVAIPPQRIQITGTLLFRISDTAPDIKYAAMIISLNILNTVFSLLPVTAESPPRCA